MTAKQQAVKLEKAVKELTALHYRPSDIEKLMAAIESINEVVAELKS